MPEQEKELRAIRGLLEQARERIDHILAPAEAVHMRSRCAGCGYIKHFTRSFPLTLPRLARNAEMQRLRRSD